MKHNIQGIKDWFHRFKVKVKIGEYDAYLVTFVLYVVGAGITIWMVN